MIAAKRLKYRFGIEEGPDMNERNADKLRIDNAQSALIRQRVEALAAITKLEVGLELLGQLVDDAPFEGMTTFERDAVTVMDHLGETSREMWTQIMEMIDTINGKSVCPANKHLVPASSPKANLVKVECHLGTGDAWAEATASRVAFFDLGLGTDGEALRLSIPVKTDSEKICVIEGLLSVAEFVESTLPKTEWP